MTTRINLKTTGPASDLEFVYKKPVSLLPHPEGLVFSKQADPIPDFQQVHTSYREMNQAIGDPDTNPLPFDFWTGTSIRQINEGGNTFNLGVNEKRKK